MLVLGDEVGRGPVAEDMVREEEDVKMRVRKRSGRRRREIKKKANKEGDEFKDRKIMYIYDGTDSGG